MILRILDKLQTYAVIRNKILRFDAEQGLDSGAHRDSTAAHGHRESALAVGGAKRD